MNYPGSVLILLMSFPCALGADTPGAGAAAARATVPLYGRFETEVKNSKGYANPFQDVRLDASFVSPSKRTLKFFGFHDGDGNGGQTGSSWKLRFMPDEAGEWSYTATFSDGEPGTSGTFTCVAAGALPGPLRVDPENRRSWVFAGGEHFFPRSYIAPELFVAADEAHRKHWIDYFFGGKHRFNLCNANLLNFVAVGDVYNWQGKPYNAPDPGGEGRYVTIGGNGLFPFLRAGPRVLLDGGSNVDWLRPSIACWANVDRVLAELEARKAVWFNHWGMIGWDWSGNGRILVPPAARNAVLRYWIARLAPWWNVTWNVAGEWDELMTTEQLDELGDFIQNHDPWRHPATSHALGTTLDRPWVDFRVEQFAAGTSADAIQNARRAIADYSEKPVFAFETSWEATPGKLTAEGVRTGAWGSVMGGAFYLYAECFEPTLTWGDGAAFPFVEILEDFIGGLDYWKLRPGNQLVNEGSLCLADPGREYVVYRPQGGPISLDLADANGEFVMEWLDPRTGARQGRKAARGGARLEIACPDTRDWALHVKKIATPEGASPARGLSYAPLALHPDNPHLFIFRGKPTVLVGCGEHYGAVLNLDFDQAAYLEELAAHGLDHTRLFSGTYRERPDSFGIQDNPLAPAPGRYACPWARSETPGYFDGGNKFDLTRWDEGYFRRLRDFVRRAGERGIVVEVSLFCTMYDEEIWRASPMNAACNVNGIGQVGPREVYSLKVPALTEVQESVTRKIVAELNDFDNLYFEVCNEPYERGGMHPDWEGRIVAAIAKAEAPLPRKHLISVNSTYEPGKAATLDPSVSICNFHVASPEAMRLNRGLGKAIGVNETGGSRRDDATYRAQGWEVVLAGGALFSHLDFSFSTSHPRGTLVDHRGPGGGSPELRRELGVLKEFTRRFDLVKMEPAPAVVVSGVPDGARVQVLAEPGRQYAIYLTGGRQARLGLEIPAGAYRTEWVSPRTGATEKREEIVHAGGVVAISSPPYDEDAALALKVIP